jgi:hypothetical protein
MDDIRLGNLLIRHYFPGVNADTLDDFTWAMYVNDALFLQEKQNPK